MSTQPAGRQRDFWLGVCLLLFALGYAWLAFHLPVRALRGEVVGPDLFPKLLAAVLAVLALPLVVQGLRYRGESRARGAAGEWGRAALVIGLMLAYVWALPRIGFLLATPAYLGVTIRLAGAERWLAILGAALAITAAVFLSFATLFAVPLPRGSWF